LKGSGTVSGRLRRIFAEFGRSFAFAIDPADLLFGSSGSGALSICRLGTTAAAVFGCVRGRFSMSCFETSATDIAIVLPPFCCACAILTSSSLRRILLKRLVLSVLGMLSSFEPLRSLDTVSTGFRSL
jgi:hypothetical protein